MSRTAADIRREFIEFFTERGHTFVPGSPVVPYDDPTLLFTNAGMNQFKDVFLGTGSRPYRRAANSQPCIRAGGKHNDLDDVGHDTYHHTCFEMLGNWSFADYFKQDAIAWAWELLTKVWGLDRDRLHATYFGGDESEGLPPDLEARDIWATMPGMSPLRIHPGIKKDNFWEMGETGPCGPCSEVHIDLTPDKSGGPLVNAGDHRVMEIWNLVFIQFNRGNDRKLTPLPGKHVDTGMGFERICGVLQGHNNNYATDVFWPIIHAVENLSGHKYGTRTPRPMGANRYAVFAPHDMQDVACRVVADHIRALTFALTDGAVPDKDGRGYVLRRILRRAVRYGWQHLGLHEPFLCKIVPTVVDVLGDAFPKLKEQTRRVIDVIREEEESFGRTLDRGIALFEEAARRAVTEHGGAVGVEPSISGGDAFRLHDTYGFPIDLTKIMARERKLDVDVGEYERLMEDARERARGSGKFQGGAATISGELVTPFGATDDSFKHDHEVIDGKVAGIVRVAGDSSAALGAGEVLRPGESAAIVFDRTCFYAEQGGQVGDTGRVGGGGVRFDVDSTVRFVDTVALVGTLVQGEIRVGQTLEQHVHENRRKIRQNHTATHVLNWALRETLGEHVQQKGSLVDADKTRFDFSHPKALTGDEIGQIEERVAEQIAAKLNVSAKEAPQGEALKINGLRAVFGEKYPDVVRVVSIGPTVDELLAAPGEAKWRGYSIEFCGGTHVKNTGDIGRFVLTGEEAVAKGIRRVVGISGEAATLAGEMAEMLENRVASLASATGQALADGAAALQSSLNDAELPLRARARLREAIAGLQQRVKAEQKAAQGQSATAVLEHVKSLAAAAPRVGGTLVLVTEIETDAPDSLKIAADAVKQSSGSAAVFLAARGEKASLLAAVTDDLVKKGIKAGDWVKAVAPVVEGGGGGPPTMAQAGGKNPAKLSDALAAARAWIEGRLQ